MIIAHRKYENYKLRALTKPELRDNTQAGGRQLNQYQNTIYIFKSYFRYSFNRFKNNLWETLINLLAFIYYND